MIVKNAGAIRSSDLLSDSGSDVAVQKASDASQMSLEALKKINMQAFEANTRVANGISPSSLASNDLQITSNLASIYTKFLESISLTLLTSISADGRWLRLGSKYGFGPLHHRNQENGDLKVESSRRELSLLSIVLKWYPSGALMATMCRFPAKYLRQVSTEGADKSTLPSVGSVVLLAPSGKEAIFVGHFSHGDHEMKTSIAARLRYQNIRISPGTNWVQIRSLSENAGDLKVSTIWPACLCFSISRKLLAKHREEISTRTTSIDEWVDPLEAAENWYNGRSARAQAVEAKRRANESLAEEAKIINESEEEDTFMYDENLLNGRLNLQDASGVYPTPPDGAPPHLHPTASTQEQSSQIEGETRKPIATPIDQGSSSLLASSTFIEDPQFNNEGDGDLFGEFDSEMFAANGLTEDDFNFFDEQNTGESEPLTSYKSIVSEKSPPEEDNICFTPQRSGLISSHSIPSDADIPQPDTGVTPQLPTGIQIDSLGW